jgi:hypothetical protein
VAAKSRFLFLLLICVAAYGHDVITTKVTFDREIVRLLNAHCVSCHREGGAAFSLATYQDARPWAKAIGEEVLQRLMPPWGAVKGFGDFRNDQGLTAEQLELIVDWEEGGSPEGDEKDLPVATNAPPIAAATPADTATEIIASADSTLKKAVMLDGLRPETVPSNASFQVTAELPDGRVEPLLWLQNYKKEYGHPFLLRRPLDLPAGTVIRGIPREANIALLSARPAQAKN